MNRAQTDKDTRLVTVCAECFKASCWHGDFMCDGSRNADTLDLPVYELQRLKREHPSYWSPEHIAKVTGETPSDLTDLRRFVAEQRAESPEFKRAYEEGKALEAKARRLEPILRQMGFSTITWVTILAVLTAASDLDSDETEVPNEDRQ